MTLATLPVDAILTLPFPSYHTPLEVARRLVHSEDEPTRCGNGVALLEGLRGRYPHVLAIGLELVLALMECRQHDRAECVLRELEALFTGLDEELLCRWGRLFKDRGDAHVALPWTDAGGREPDPDLAEGFYRRALERYDRAYRIRSGHYPGINTATLLLILGAMRPSSAGESPRPVPREAEELAGALLDDRPRWPREQADDATLWHPATAGEAHLLRREWAAAARQYRAALSAPGLTPRVREAMSRQVRRILACFEHLGLAIPPPFDDPAAFFAANSPPTIGPGDAGPSPGPPSPDPGSGPSI